MQHSKTLLLVLTLTGLSGCKDENALNKYGAELPKGAAMAVGKVLAEPAEWDGSTVIVHGHVRQACTKKGCWMEIADTADATSPGCRVTFKDYGFFVPKDSAGAHARLEGKLEIKTVSAEDVKHLESEGGKFTDKNPDGSAKEISIVANGVELKKG